MNVEMLNTLSLVAFIAAGVMFLISVALFFLLDIPKVVGEVSGKTAKKSIQRIQQHNAGDSERIIRSSGKGKNLSKPGYSGRVGVGTEKIASSKVRMMSEETTVLVENTVNKEQNIVGVPNQIPVNSVYCEEVESLSSYSESEIIE